MLVTETEGEEWPACLLVTETEGEEWQACLLVTETERGVASLFAGD